MSFRTTLRNTTKRLRNTTGKAPKRLTSLETLITPRSTKAATQDRPIPIRTTGSRHLPFQTDPVITKGPGQSPPGWSGAFPGGASEEEWSGLYWPIWKVLRCKGDPRQPPYVGCSTGNKSFKYQSNFGGGRLKKGGQVIDAEVTYNGITMAVRLMTERYHAAAKREQQVRDMLGKVELARFNKVCDLWTQNFISDATGEAACQNFAMCLRMSHPPDPFTWGFKRVRPGIKKKATT